VAQILELAHLVEQDGMTEVEIGRGGIETGFDAQRSPRFKFLDQLGFDKKLVAAAPDDFKGVFDGRHGIFRRRNGWSGKYIELHPRCKLADPNAT
jgi:hypothetical protein